VVAESDAFGRTNALAVKAAMEHAWSGYRKHAWGYDALKPVSGRGENPWGGIGCTLVDSLDVLWLMGMKVGAGWAAQGHAGQTRMDRLGAGREAWHA
jgi:hypothetical protein